MASSMSPPEALPPEADRDNGPQVGWTRRGGIRVVLCGLLCVHHTNTKHRRRFLVALQYHNTHGSPLWLHRQGCCISLMRGVEELPHNRGDPGRTPAGGWP